MGLILIFTSVIVSVRYLKKESGYDTIFSKYDRIARLSLAFDGKQADGRIYGNMYQPMLKQLPEIEDVLRFSNISAITIQNNDVRYVANNMYVADLNFFDFFDFTFLEGKPETAFDSPGKIVVTKKLAMSMFGRTDILGSEIQLSGRQYSSRSGFISGVIADLPENTHLRADIFISDDNVKDLYSYYYLLLKKGTDINMLAEQITESIRKNFDQPYNKSAAAEILPLKDIHLYSRVQRELSPNGNIDYVYLIAGANILLFIIVLFNLWLNSGIIFSYNKRYYQLLRLNGAYTVDLIKDELRIAFFTGCVSLFFSLFISFYFIKDMSLDSVPVTIPEQLLLFFILIISVIGISLIPVIKSASETLFNNLDNDLKPIRFSFSNIRYMLVIQYAIVIFIVIIAMGINNQISLIKTTQVGATNDSIIVFKEQPEEVIEKYPVFKKELESRPGITYVAGAMQLPGDAVRDASSLKVEGNPETIVCPIMIVGEDFFSLFNIHAIEGTLPPLSALTYNDEIKMLNDKLAGGAPQAGLKENLVINRKALSLLGFSSPQEAIGKEIIIDHNSLNYIPSGIICGVVEDFIYTNVFEDVIPLLIFQRNLFMNCFMVSLSPDQTMEGLKELNDVWHEINPDYPLNYSFLKDSYSVLYKNELDAEKIVNLFSTLCLLVTILGLIVFMAFIVRIRTKEVAIRKVNGASYTEIMFMLNKSLLVWVLLAYIFAIPVAWFIMTKWLENFAYRAILSWTMFIGAGIFVLLLSLFAVSWQSWKAAKINPVIAMKTD